LSFQSKLTLIVECCPELINRIGHVNSVYLPILILTVNVDDALVVVIVMMKYINQHPKRTFACIPCMMGYMTVCGDGFMKQSKWACEWCSFQSLESSTRWYTAHSFALLFGDEPLTSVLLCICTENDKLFVTISEVCREPRGSKIGIKKKHGVVCIIQSRLGRSLTIYLDDGMVYSKRMALIGFAIIVASPIPLM
jgi:hypothetical protein